MELFDAVYVEDESPIERNTFSLYGYPHLFSFICTGRRCAAPLISLYSASTLSKVSIFALTPFTEITRRCSQVYSRKQFPKSFFEMFFGEIESS